MIKLLVTSGCSYSQVPNADVTWPVHLSKELNIPSINLGKGATGNGMISRTVIYEVTKALNIYKNDEILVGIMWSSLNRFEIYKKEKDIGINNIFGDIYYCNPQSITSDFNTRNYILVNQLWNDELSKLFYKNIYSSEYGCIINLEHILRTQWFLKEKNIKYFMTFYNDDGLPGRDTDNDPDVQFLYSQLDWNNIVKVYDMGGWARKTGLPYARPPDPHPSSEMHELYVNQHIIPHLVERNIISDK